MKSHALLFARVLEDVSIRCCVSTTRDLKMVLRRIEQEGESFLTISLPTLCDLLERGLAEGGLWCHGYGKPLTGGQGISPDDENRTNFPHRTTGMSRTDLVGFKIRRGTALPQFLYGVWAQVFDSESGRLLDDPSIEAVQALRQVCNLFKKILTPCSDARVEAAFARFIECDNEVGEISRNFEPWEILQFEEMAKLVFWDLFYGVDLAIWAGDVIPKHGPGATADRIKANAKYDNRVWTTRLEKLFFAGDFLYPSWSHFLEAENRGEGPTWLEPGEELPVRVVSVPKTQKTPRIIAIEPTHMQYVQQGIAELLVDGIERDDLLSHFIGFSDQEYSRTLAREGSSTGDLATLDLSDASDRVSCRHVRSLFARHTVLSTAVSACRSQTANVPGHGVITLNKFASMGSALTFPIEAMVFLTIVLIGIQIELNRPLTRKDLRDLVGRVRVYGDDIVVPVEYADSVSIQLESYGLRVNHRKSFWTGKFRESCGGEYYDGFDVGYVKVRRNLPSARKHVREIVSTVATRNLFYERGYWRTAEYLDELLGGLIPFPRVGPESPGLGRFSYLGYDAERECPYLQRPLVKAAVVQSKLPHSEVSGQGALLKYFLKRSDEPIHDEKHLERAGRPVAVNIRLRWVPSY